MTTKDDLKRRLGLPVLGDRKPIDPRFEGQHPSHRKIEVLLSEHAGIDLQLLQTWAYVEVYERTQHYGGPEEGGWYYHALHPAGPCVPFIAVVVKSGGEGDQVPAYQDDVPHGVEYLLVRYSEMVDDPCEDDGHWRLIAILTEDLVKVSDMLVEVGFEQYSDRYGNGQQVLLSGFPGHHTTRRRPRYE